MINHFLKSPNNISNISTTPNKNIHSKSPIRQKSPNCQKSPNLLQIPYIIKSPFKSKDDHSPKVNNPKHHHKHGLIT